MLPRTITRTARRAQTSCRAPTLFLRGSRNVSTLPENPHIYVFKHPLDPARSLLTLLPTNPPTLELALGSCTSIPPTPANFTENASFHPILQSVLHNYATQDPNVRQQAAVFASPGGFNLGARSGSNDGAGGANHQAGMGGANRGGWIHVSDERNPPDWGRIAWPEDIFGSVEVDGNGMFVSVDGNYQDSGTYRMVTREGILGLTPFLREKLVERLRQLESQMRKK
ncbi:hypothetical protein BU26DRAFT_518493 [Trematosphaeria pertusa]|uniref:Uncharacterized protein n=1 Tax=Trematosphaeria pertusa TaxID=390896 RepID=A0A6A6IIM1_9PLEO|nr:uncharacterized protein BU26DRAFT_518493 [Trematosphaeria pertusa]KAF2250027.1 hypothetical protein BU26DRAFT_518493 [Trematosphaeria pertusa]